MLVLIMSLKSIRFSTCLILRLSLLQEFADQLQIPFLETSAKNATNVEQAFMTMAAEIKRAQGPDNGHVTGSGNTVRITPVSQPISSKKDKGGCC